MVAGGDSAANRQNRRAGRGQVAVIDGIAVNGGVIRGGTARAAIISSAKTRPRASSRGTVSTPVTGARGAQPWAKRRPPGRWAVLGETIVGQLARSSGDHLVETLVIDDKGGDRRHVVEVEAGHRQTGQRLVAGDRPDLPVLGLQ